MNISIITPTFNREECIVRCLDSVTSQLGSMNQEDKIEHVIVDDGSTDNSAGIIREYASRHPHVTPLFFEKNRGVNAARNAAIRIAHGEWCLLLDSDDRLAPDAIASIIETVKRFPSYESYLFSVDDRIRDMEKLGQKKVFRFEDFLLERTFGDFGHLLKRKLLLAHPFDEYLRIYEGIFFLNFYKDAGEMLFTNVVTHERDRDRTDSVSLTFIRYNDEIIKRKLKSAKLQLDTFRDDYRAFNEQRIPQRLSFEIADNAVLLGDYATARAYLKDCDGSLKSRILKAITATHTGSIYKKALQLYLAAKYNRPQRGVS